MRIETERLRLEAPRPEDFQDYRGFLAAGSADANDFPAFGREDSWARLLRHVGHWACFGFGIMLVRDRADGRLVGEAGIGHFERGVADHFGRSPEAGWRIALERQGQGYAGEAMAAAIRWFDDSFAFDRTVCMIYPDNAPSLRVAARLGYTRYAGDRYKDKPIHLFERLRPA